MKKLLTVLLQLTLLLITAQQTDISGTYSYGNGYGYEYLTLTDENQVRISRFTDNGGKSRKSAIATYTLAGDSLKLTYLSPRLERKLSQRFGYLFIIKEHDRFRALLPPAEVANWETHLERYEKMNEDIGREIPDRFLSQLFDEAKIYIKPK